MVEDESGHSGPLVLATLLGGVLLLAALAARFLFGQEFYHGVLALVAAVLLGTPLVVQALGDLLDGRTEMNELVALGVVAAFAAGEYLTAGAISFFMIISALIEARTATGARRAIESLIRLTPTRAVKVVQDPDGAEREVEVEAQELRPGDVVRVRPGENVPGDGVIVAGFSTLNEANITGESMPVDKEIDGEVFGGTINETGVLDVRVTSAGADTTLGRVQELVLEAEKTRTPAMRLADRYANWYTPVVLMVALIVLVFTRDLNRVIALLLIACPCSIILATPTAIVAALSAAARLGVLVKNVSDLERARHLSAIIFDKTGTLTTGRLSVTRLGPRGDVSPEELLAVAAQAERNSNHPVARAVLKTAERASVPLPDSSEFEEVPGRGVRAVIRGQSVLVGRATWLGECGIDLPQEVEAPPSGASLLYVARAGTLLGWIGLEDQIRPEAAAAIDRLRAQGVDKLAIVTGDRRSVAERVARDVNVSDIYAEVVPQEKLDVVEELKNEGHTVAVVGDGVNDAPALAAGDLSVAMGAAGSDVAIHSASVALMNSNLDRVPFLIGLSKNTGRVITQGIAFSIVYILVFGFLSASGQIHPVLAAVLHSLSSIIVVFNSARLVREGEDIESGPGDVRDSIARPATGKRNPEGAAPQLSGT